MRKLLATMFIGIGLATSAHAGSSQLERGVVNKLRQLDSSIVLPEMQAHDYAVLKSILSTPEYTNDVKTSMVRNHLRKVDKFGTGAGTVFGLFKIGR